MRWHLALAAALIGVWAITAHAASTIQPNLLPLGIPANAGLINQNFGNAINDVNALQTQNAGVTPPSNPSIGNLWLQPGSPYIPPAQVITAAEIIAALGYTPVMGQTTSVVGDCATWNNTDGSLLKDGGCIPVINAVTLGADPTGTNDSTAAATTGCTQAATTGVPLYFPAGTYKFLSQITCAMPSATAGLTVLGASATSSILYWSAASGGWNVTGTTSHNAYHFRDLALRCATTNCGTAVALTNTGSSTYALNEPSSFTRVSIEGTDVAAGTSNTDFWQYGVVINGVSLVNFDGYYYVGSATGGYNGTGALLEAVGAVPFGVQYNFVNSNFVLGNRGIDYESGAQGVSVVNSNFTSVNEGIYSNCTAGCVGLDVVNTQFETQKHDIDIEGAMGNYTIGPGNTIYVPAGYCGVNINTPTGPTDGAISGIITGTQFEPVSGASEGNGICGSGNPPGGGALVQGNTFLNVPEDIVLGANADGWQIGANGWGGGSALIDGGRNTNYLSNPQYIFGQAAVNFAANGLTQWVGQSLASAGAGEGAVVQVFPANGKIFQFLAGVAPYPPSGQSITFTFRLPTTIGSTVFTCTLSGGGPTTLCAASGVEPVAGGIPFDVQVTASSSSVPITTIDYSIYYAAVPP
jgi:hypothetical protein